MVVAVSDIRVAISEGLTDMASKTVTTDAHGGAALRGKPGRAAHVGLWIAQVVAAAAFLLAAAMKFSGQAQVVATFDTIGFGDWFLYLIAALETAGAVALLIPVLSGLAGLAFAGLMIGAVVVHLFVVGEGAALVAAYLVLAAVIAWGRRGRTAQLIDLVRGAR